ncbi:MAG TPA: glycosyltransferase [Acidimicrobiales bacterium]|nr:glycosyltransferase [Acidimicrobiales bacterium]
MSVALSLVIPAYNEAERLGVGFERLWPTLATMDPSTVEIIVIDDGSSDETLKRAHEVYGHMEHVLFVQQPSNLGKGAAVRLGIALARGTYVITVDADMAIDPVQLPNFVSALHDSALVPGSRALSGDIKYDARLRTFAGATFNRLVRHYSGTTLRDTQCGCKGFQLGPARLLALLAMIDGFAFDVEMLYLAQRLGLSVSPLLVTWQDVRGSSVRPGRDAWTMVRDIRGLKRTRYENPVVELSASVGASDVARLAKEARLHGLVLARNDHDALLVLGRDGALGGLAIASALSGTLRTARLDELTRRRYEAV